MGREETRQQNFKRIDPTFLYHAYANAILFISCGIGSLNHSKHMSCCLESTSK